jgi:uncharacterized YigZ family protein
MPDLLVPAAPAQAEIEILRSRFIAHLAYTPDITAAKEHLAAMRLTFQTASHHVSAFIIGHGASTTEHCSDAGEPAGTAGRPVLLVLKGSGLGDASLVVTRYFGGTKLGTGGLVQAYTAAAQAVLAQTPIARKIATHQALLAVPYSDYQSLQRLITQHHGVLLASEFAADVTLSIRFAVPDFAPFQAALQEQSNGQSQAVLVAENEITLLPQ